MNRFDQRAEDELRADHEDGHPDGPPAMCHYCEYSPVPEVTSIDDPIPQRDIPWNEVRKSASED